MEGRKERSRERWTKSKRAMERVRARRKTKLQEGREERKKAVEFMIGVMSTNKGSRAGLWSVEQTNSNHSSKACTLCTCILVLYIVCLCENTQKRWIPSVQLCT